MASNIQIGYNGQIIKVGDKVRHFKYETLTEQEKAENLYIYTIIGFGQHTETNELCVIYQSVRNHEVWIRPVDMFMSEVDSKKYPNIKQKYRFEKI